jgi:deoxyribodipyrimidine photo-lyase
VAGIPLPRGYANRRQLHTPHPSRRSGSDTASGNPLTPAGARSPAVRRGGVAPASQSASILGVIITSLDHLLSVDRDERISALAAALPARPRGDSVADACRLAIRGGREPALRRLAAIDPVAYARTRNDVGGAVTMLSPWLRHGVVSLAEVRDAALARVREPRDAEKLVSELGWRDYWRAVHAALGRRIRDPIEPPAALPRTPPADTMPEDVLAGRTGMACIDAFVKRLHETGWLHNHERMWLASWLVHVRGVRWQAGADWFLSHLIDGDPASNHLSWQWIAGTFSAKPYLFNRENLERFTGGVHCRICPVRGRCDVEGSYEALAARLFRDATDTGGRPPLRIAPAAAWRLASADQPRRPLVWLTLDSLGATSPAAARNPHAPRLFVLDPAWLDEERPSLKRLAFIFECLADVENVEVVLGSALEAVPAVARRHGCDAITVAATPCPAIREAAAAIAAALPVVVVDEPAFCDRSRVRDVGRFSRYWSQVSRSALAPTPAG